MESSPPSAGNGGASSSSPGHEDDQKPHGALFLVLSYLRLPELLRFQLVCRSFRAAIADDWTMWRRVSVEPPLNARLTDDALLQVISKAEGKLESLALLDCWRITDAGLQAVVDRNPGIVKLSVPGCTCLTADGLTRIVKELSELNRNLKRLQLRGVCNITREHLDILKSILYTNNGPEISHPSFYHQWQCVPINRDDDRPMDVDMCPKCKNVRLIFDCTREECRLMKNKWTECRGCFFCIARCEMCGGCIQTDDLDAETVCSHLLCMHCWLHLPKCNMCNRPYCTRRCNFDGIASESHRGFVCEHCCELENSFQD